MSTRTKHSLEGRGPTAGGREAGLVGRRLWLLGGIIIGMGFTPLAGMLLDDGPAAEGMTLQWVDAIESHDLDLLVDLYSEDATWDDPAFGDHFEGRQGVRNGWGIFTFADFEVRELEVMTVDEDSATVRWILAGSRSPFTGEPWEIEGVSVLGISVDAIVSETVYYDSAGVKSIPSPYR